MSKSTRKTRLQKPRPDFPLFPHNPTEPNRARWAKKVRGRLHYFGKVADDPKGQAALDLWLDQKDDLLAGRTPRSKQDVLTVEKLVNLWLDFKKKRIATGELSQRCWDDYQKLCVVVVGVWGRNRAAADLGPADFGKLRETMAKRWGPTRLGNSVQYVKGIFAWAQKEELMPLPSYGAGFVKPSAKMVREARNGRGPRMLEPDEIHALLKVAGVNLKGMILLAANGGIGPSDLARLPIGALDLESGWADYPRHKTGIPRRIPLWPETVKALEAVLANRSTPRQGCEQYVFLRPRGCSYVGRLHGERIAAEFRKTAKAAGVKGHGMYDLRRGFQTIGEGARDLVAVQTIMGHAAAASDMSAVYRQRVDDDRLQAVVDHVRAWVFGEKVDEKDDTKPSTAGS